MTTSPLLDIIVPVWNSPVEARSCIVSVLESSDSARLIIINNGCDRATELMLEEFSDHLGTRAIYMTMERNIGFVPAVNRALARSDADWALIARPNCTITADCVRQLMGAAACERAGIVTPYCRPDMTEHPQLLRNGCAAVETAELSFTVLALSRKMREQIGLFDEELDGGPWCLRDYRHRSHAGGFRCYLTPGVTVEAVPVTVFGSEERRRRQGESAALTVQRRWGRQRQIAVYLPKSADERAVADTLQLLLAAARHGHRFQLFLHRRHHRVALQHGAACLHSGIVVRRLGILAPAREMMRELDRLQRALPELQVVSGLDGCTVPGYDAALSPAVLHQLASA